MLNLENQAFGTSTVFMIIVGLLFVLLFFVVWSQIERGRSVNLRALTPVSKLRRLIEQSAESDTAVHFSPGNGGLSAGQGGVPEALNGLTALSSLSRTTARTKGKTIVTTNDALSYIVSDDIKRSEYIEAGREEDYEPTDARFITQQDRTGYIAGIAATVADPKISANVMLGHFGDEVLLATEQAARRQLPQVTGTTQLEGLPLLLATAGNENTLLGEEVFAVPAYLERKAPYLASLQVQDWFRIAAIIAIILGTIVATVGVPIGNYLLH
jgi:hypothetical protein